MAIGRIQATPKNVRPIARKDGEDFADTIIRMIGPNVVQQAYMDVAVRGLVDHVATMRRLLTESGAPFDVVGSYCEALHEGMTKRIKRAEREALRAERQAARAGRKRGE